MNMLGVNNSAQKSYKSELVSGGKQMFEVGRWVRKYFENWAFGCENISKIQREVQKYFHTLAHYLSFGILNILLLRVHMIMKGRRNQ